MSDILFTCRACHQDLVVDVTGAGLTIACPGCGKPVKVPAKGDTGIIRVPEATALRSRMKELESSLAAEHLRASTAESSLNFLTELSAKAEEAARKAASQIADLEAKIAERDVAVQVLEEALASEVAKAANQQKTSDLALEAALKAEQTTACERDELGTKLERSESIATEAKHQQAELQKSLAAASEEVQAGSSQLAELGRSMEELRVHDRAMTGRAEYLEHEVERLSDDFARAQRDLSEATGTLRELENKLRASESEREELTLAAANAEHDSDLLQRNRDLAAHRDRLTAELAETRAALLRTETQLYHAMSAREGLGAMVASLRVNLRDTSELYHQMAATVDTLESEVQRLQKKLHGIDQREAA